jgi:thiamine pyrophosphokinase
MISVFCLSQEARLDIEGLKYTLKNGILQPSFPLGVSNQFVGKESLIRVKKGTVLVIWDRG